MGWWQIRMQTIGVSFVPMEHTSLTYGELQMILVFQLAPNVANYLPNELVDAQYLVPKSFTISRDVNCHVTIH